MKPIVIIIAIAFVFLLFPQTSFSQNVTENSIQSDPIVNDSATVDVEKSEKDNFSLTEIITLGAVIVNGVLVFFIYKTFRQNSEHHISINRPWISLQIGNIDGDDNCEFILKNQGKLVVENMKISCKNRAVKPHMELDVTHQIFYLLPSQESKFYFNIADMVVENVGKKLRGGFNVDAEITISYLFSKKNKKIVYEVVLNYEFGEQYTSIKLLDFD